MSLGRVLPVFVLFTFNMSGRDSYDNSLVFYVQLFAITHGVDPKIAFYTVKALSSESS